MKPAGANRRGAGDYWGMSAGEKSGANVKGARTARGETRMCVGVRSEIRGLGPIGESWVPEAIGETGVRVELGIEEGSVVLREEDSRNW